MLDNAATTVLITWFHYMLATRKARFPVMHVYCWPYPRYMRLHFNDSKLTAVSPLSPCPCVCARTAGDITLIPGTVGFSLGSSGVMFQGFPGDFDTISRGSSSPSIESQYLSSVDSFGSPPASASQVRTISQMSLLWAIIREREFMCPFPTLSESLLL